MHGELPLSETRRRARARPPLSGQRPGADRDRRRALLGVHRFAGAAAAAAGRFAAAGPVPVLVGDRGASADVPVYLDAVGTAKALNTVTVRPQVDGKLISVNFKEGQDVKKGDVLAQIDPTTYQAQLRSGGRQEGAGRGPARQRQARSRALPEARRHQRHQQAAGRHAEGAGRAVLTRRCRPTRRRSRTPRATLDYTTITAPIDGRTGIRQVDEGNIVRASDASSASSSSRRSSRSRSVQPAAAAADAGQRRPSPRARSRSRRSAPTTTRSSTAARSRVIDNQVDQTTGTVKLKAEFPNADLQLWPGQFVNVRLLIDTLNNVVVDPDRRGAARPERHLRLRGRQRRQGRACGRSWCSARTRCRPWSRAALRRRSAW